MKKLIVIIVSSIILVLVIRALMKRYMPKTVTALGIRRDKTKAAIKAKVASIDESISDVVRPCDELEEVA